MPGLIGAVLLVAVVVAVRAPWRAAMDTASRPHGTDRALLIDPLVEGSDPSSVRASDRTPVQSGGQVPAAQERRTLVVEVLRGDRPAEPGIPVVLRQFDPPSVLTFPTDDGGVARFDAPRAGLAIVSVDAAAIHGGSRPPSGQSGGQAASIDDALEQQRRDPPFYEVLDVPEEGDVGVILAIRPPGAVLGALMGPNGEPVAVALVILLYEGTALGRFELRTLTDATGAFTFSAVRSGSYRLQVSMDAKDPPLDLHGRSMREHAAPLRTEVRVLPNETTYVVVALGSGSHEIRGRVVDPSGSPQRDLGVLVYAGNSAAPRLGHASDWPGTNWGDAIAFVTTDERGQYRILGAHPGIHLVQVDPYGFESPPGVARLAHWVTPTTVTISQSEPLVEVPPIVVVPSEPCTLTGSLIVSSAWRPGALVRLRDFKAMARPASAPIRATGKRYPWESHVTDEGAFSLTIERGGTATDEGVELRIEHAPTGDAREFIISKPREGVVMLPAVHFP